MLQSHENWKIEHSQITRNPPSSKLSLADLVVKEPGDEGHRLGGVGHEALQLHLYNKVYSTVCTVQYRPHLAALLDVDVGVSEDGGRGCDHHQPHPSAGGHHTLGRDQESMPTNPPLPL